MRCRGDSRTRWSWCCLTRSFWCLSSLLHSTSWLALSSRYTLSSLSHLSSPPRTSSILIWASRTLCIHCAPWTHWWAGLDGYSLTSSIPGTSLLCLPHLCTSRNSHCIPLRNRTLIGYYPAFGWQFFCQLSAWVGSCRHCDWGFIWIEGGLFDGMKHRIRGGSSCIGFGKGSEHEVAWIGVTTSILIVIPPLLLWFLHRWVRRQNLDLWYHFLPSVTSSRTTNILYWRYLA